MTSATANAGDPPIIGLDTNLARLPFVVLAAAVGGAINSIAGGGTLLTFPALIALGIPALVANATSTVALWPGALGSIWGYRGELSGVRRWAFAWAVPSLLGGFVGAWLLLRTSASLFEGLVPWLVLGATTLFIVQRPVMERLRARMATQPEPHDPSAIMPTRTVLLYQFGVGVYGGYFGAGIGILMLAALGFLGFTNIHRMNGLKNFGALCVNAVAAITFAMSSLVNWPVALAMAVGAVIGGYAGSRMAQRVSQLRVRQAIIVIGLASGVWLLAYPF
ncbi:MAG: sulfite exporter TauE/SafE family protein [Gemmatimonadaceae bacterium]